MKKLESPIRNWKAKHKNLAWLYFIFGPSWREYRDSLVAQAESRGVVPPEAWSTPARLRVAKEVERILCEGWQATISFHPDDPWEIVGEWEIGDISEVEHLFEIEDTFKIKLPKDIESRIAQGLTFGQMIDYIVENMKS